MNGLHFLLIVAVLGTANVVSGIETGTKCVKNDKCPAYQDPDDKVVHLPVDEDCHMFYKCNYGQACLWECPKVNQTLQLVYNPKLEVCDWPWSVEPRPNCPDQGYPWYPTPAPNPPTDNPTKPPVTPPTRPPVTPPTNRPPIVSSCPSTGTINIAHETDCNYYYECRNGVATLRKCLENLVFNPIIEECDYRWNYPCETTRPVTPTL